MEEIEKCIQQFSWKTYWILGVVKWALLAQNRAQWQVLVNKVMLIWVP